MKFDEMLSDKVDRCREWQAKFNQGANGMLPCQKFSPRFPISRCSGFLDQRSEKIGKCSKIFKKVGKGSASLIQTCFRGRFFFDF